MSMYVNNSNLEVEVSYLNIGVFSLLASSLNAI
nr:MAG TPA: hypothetical protein [Caudoviricetes sp.]